MQLETQEEWTTRISSEGDRSIRQICVILKVIAALAGAIRSFPSDRSRREVKGYYRSVERRDANAPIYAIHHVSWWAFNKQNSPIHQCLTQVHLGACQRL